MPIYIDDLLHIPEAEINKVKIKFNQTNYEGTNPLEEYKKDPGSVNDGWLLWRTKKSYFYAGQTAICLLQIAADEWLLTTIKAITKDLGIYDGITYETQNIAAYEKYFGRVIIKYHKTERSNGLYYNPIKDKLEVLQILPSTFDGDDFPGYDQVRVTYEQLEIIIKRGKKDWVNALKNQKAVYLITDKATGKLYVGSATSDSGMLLQRWSDYVKNGHGGNKELCTLVEQEGFAYIKQNFQYSILENYNAKIDDHVILERESWWKETLQSRKWGYNRN